MVNGTDHIPKIKYEILIEIVFRKYENLKRRKSKLCKDKNIRADTYFYCQMFYLGNNKFTTVCFEWFNNQLKIQI